MLFFVRVGVVVVVVGMVGSGRGHPPSGPSEQQSNRMKKKKEKERCTLMPLLFALSVLMAFIVVVAHVAICDCSFCLVLPQLGLAWLSEPPRG